MRKTSTRMLALGLSVIMAVSSFTGFGGDITAYAAGNSKAIVASMEDATPGDATPGDATPGDATPGDATPGEPAVDASKYKVTLSATSYVYDGTAKKPAVKVTGKSGKELKLGEDYTVSYTDNTLPGTAKAVVTYKDKYTGTAEATFKISQATIGGVKAVADSSSVKLSWKAASGVSVYVVSQNVGDKWKAVYTGSAETATIKKLSANTSYKFQITGQRKLKSGKVVDVAKSAVKAVSTSKIAASSFAVTLGAKTYTYDGAAKKPAVKVADKSGKALKAGQDYTVSYKDNTLPGTAKAVVTYKGKYTGTATRTFKINQATIGGVKATAGSSSIKLSWKKTSGVSRYVVSQNIGGKWKTVYTGTAVAATIKNLSANTSYKFQITGQRKLNPGKYVDVAKSAVKAASTSKIVASGYAVTLGRKTYVYDGAAKKPAVKVTDKSGKALKAGKDYTVTYANNVLPGTAKVVVTYKGKYSGAVKKTFKISQATIGGVKTTAGSSAVKVSWKKANGVSRYVVTQIVGGKRKNVYVGSAVTVTIKKLSANTGYKFQITGQRKLKSGKYVDVAKSAVKAASTTKIAANGFKVTLSKKTFVYDGKAKKPAVKITGVVNGKKVTLKKGTDYTYSYVKNVRPGTASVKITYKGKYKGTKTVNFKITAKK